MKDYPVILVAGASGYIGKALIPELRKKFPHSKIVALSRRTQDSNDPGVQWKECDIFSLKSIESAIPSKVDLAFYLVHSMGPTAGLDQGSFADFDVILADNFARALKKVGITQLIYLGGIIPDEKNLSLHLQSRLEVEETFLQFGMPTTIFRAGIILGNEGSSFQILLKLVTRLPIMICPSWTQTVTSPVDLPTVIKSLVSAALEKSHFGRIYDLVGCKPLSYLEMMEQTSRRIGKKRFFFTVPIFTPTLSRLWVSLITNTSKDLVYPLIESLRHPMVAREDHVFSGTWKDLNYSDLLAGTQLEIRSGGPLFTSPAQRQTVRSVQRIVLPVDKDAMWLLKQYFNWVSKFIQKFAFLQIEPNSFTILVFSKKIELLRLSLNSDKSDSDRQILNIDRGLLVAKDNLGWMEFREVLNRRFVLVALHDYRTALPWFIYKNTQARIHLYIMKKFIREMNGRGS